MFGEDVGSKDWAGRVIQPVPNVLVFNFGIGLKDSGRGYKPRPAQFADGVANFLGGAGYSTRPERFGF
nr:hypothetical protein [Methylomarinum sp. Ch1-1]MDP4522831.1 hypothetical protein [Methylomarinum sp. Ch1-1]